MKQFLKQYALRGLISAGFGPAVLAIIYAALGASGALQSLTPNEVCRGIFSVLAISFIAGGMPVIYSVERLPVVTGALIHGAVLYAGYLLMYLLNNWIPRNTQALLLFTAIFLIAYAIIWAIIYLVNRRAARRLTRRLAER